MKDNITCMIVDDEPKAIALLQDSLHTIDKRVTVTDTYTSWSEALEGLRTKECDIVFLDISIQGKNGMDLLRTMPGLRSEIIFVTAHSDYALNAFQFSTSGYLLKPIDEVELAIALNKAIERIQYRKQATRTYSVNEKIGIPDTKSVNYLHVRDIIYLEAKNSYTRVVSRFGEIVSAYNMGRFRELLPEQSFYQVHRSFIVNIDSIRRYENTGTIVLENGEEIPVAQKNRPALLNLFTRIKTHDK